MTCATPQSIRACIPVLIYNLRYSVAQTCQIIGIKKTTVYNTLCYYKDNGIPTNLHAHPSHGHWKLSTNDVSFIHALLKQCHTLYLDEIQLQLLQKQNDQASVSTLVHTLCRIHFSSKVVSVKARERNDILCVAYMNQIGTIVTDMDQVMCVDESAKDDWMLLRKSGWSPIGTWRCFIHGCWCSILPIFTIDGIITYNIMEGLVTSEKFVHFLRELVVSSNTLTCLLLILNYPADSTH